MAKFELELPTELIAEIERVSKDSDKIFGGMTQAGAEVAYKTVLSNLPKGLRDSKDFARHIYITKSYKTPSDDGINNKVKIAGYFNNKNGVKTPAPLVANMFEYGSNSRNFPKQPFFRKSFRPSQIEAAMLKAQKELSGGLLE
jgi:hypothetical protein